MELDQIEIIELELKYCERCGGLWLRPRGAQHVYCSPCVFKMATFPTADRCKGRVRLPRNDHPHILPPVPWCAEGGNA